jgi:DNA polymerase-4
MSATTQACPETRVDLNSSCSSGFTPLSSPCPSAAVVAAGLETGVLSSLASASASPSTVSSSKQARPASAIPHIAHIHVDGFFASVEQAIHPKYRGKPVVVGRNGVISASYEAKLLGIATGMPINQALALCPGAIILPGHYDRYAEYAERVRAILESACPAVDPDAHHGFYLNFFGSTHLRHDFPGTLRRLQLEILKVTGLSVSIGAAKSKVVAAIASRLERPRGLRIVAPETESALLPSLPVEALDAINNIDAPGLRKRGISTVAELRRVPLHSLESAYGDAIGRQIWYSARGLDGRPTVSSSGSPALSREAIINAGTTDAEFLATLTQYLCERIANALRGSHRQARTLNLRILYVVQFSASQSLRLPIPANDARQLLASARSLLQSLFTRRIPVHSLTISVTTTNSTSSSASHLHETAISASA